MIAYKANAVAYLGNLGCHLGWCWCWVVLGGGGGVDVDVGLRTVVITAAQLSKQSVRIVQIRIILIE